jgi:hypothetical protein
MPKIIVISDPDARGASAVTLEERVISEHVEDEHAAAQLVQRLGWAVADAERMRSRPFDRPRPLPGTRPHAGPEG